MDMNRRFRPERAGEQSRLRGRSEQVCSSLLFVPFAVWEVPVVTTVFVDDKGRLVSSSFAT